MSSINCLFLFYIYFNIYLRKLRESFTWASFVLWSVSCWAFHQVLWAQQYAHDQDWSPGLWTILFFHYLSSTEREKERKRHCVLHFLLHTPFLVFLFLLSCWKGNERYWFILHFLSSFNNWPSFSCFLSLGPVKRRKE